MKLCPSCGNSYPDDANFCPMDATRLPAAVADAPATIPTMPVAPAAAAVTQPDQPAPIGGRFVLAGVGMQTPTGLASAANDPTTGASVVVKMVAPEVLPTTAMADRALRELKQLGKVTSDRIVRVVDQGRLADGRVYVVTERVDGAATLEELVAREGPLPLDRAKAIVLQVGEALTEAQKVGVIHRDVAPRNVLVGPGDRVKVGDFGLAEPVSDRVFGAPGFLSPEQAEGKPVDQRSNIYSLGAVYYFALTGKAPFAGDTASLMQQHLSAVPQPPSTLRVGIGADIDRVIGKALEKSGGRRHLTLRQLLTEVGATSTSGVPAQPMRAGAEAKTMMAMEAPQIPAPVAQPKPATVPSRVQAETQARTMMGIPQGGPVGSMGPGSTAPSMPAVAPPPPQAPPQAATVMAEAPAPRPMPQPAPRAQPVPPSQPVQAAPPPQPAPVPQAPPQAATMMAEAPRAAAAAPAPAPVNHSGPSATPAHGAKANNQASQTGKKGAFRETAWFKRGELEEEMAKAQAAAGENALKSGVTGQHLPVDESQVDLSQQDRQRLSLKTGATQAMPVMKAPVQALPGERMDEEEMLAELNPSRKYFLVAGAIVLAIVLGIVIYFATRPAPHAEAPVPDKPAPVAASPPAPTTPPTPPSAVAVTPSAPKPTLPATPSPAPAPPTVTPSPSLYAAQVTKLEDSGASVKEVKKLEKLVALELKTAHKKKEHALEAADRELLLRLKKLHAK